MAEVTVQVGGRNYRLGCEDGEEEHLTSLASRIDAEAQKLSRSMGQVAEGRLLLMSALIIADRLSDAQKQIVRLERKLADLERAAEERARSGGSDAQAREAAMVAEIERLALRLEALTRSGAGSSEAE